MAICFNRLRKIAEHLRHGKLGHVKFDFNHVHMYSNLTEAQKAQGHCGTLGCAMGELPIVFPKEWAYNYDGGAGIRMPNKESEGSNWLGIDHAHLKEFLGLDTTEINHLFYPNMQRQEWLPPERKRVLYGTASKESVARNIEWFCENKGFRPEEAPNV